MDGRKKKKAGSKAGRPATFWSHTIAWPALHATIHTPPRSQVIHERNSSKTTHIARTVWRRRWRAWWCPGASSPSESCRNTYTGKGQRKEHWKGQACGHLVTNWPPNQIAIKEGLELCVHACVCAVCGPWIFQGTMQSDGCTSTWIIHAQPWHERERRGWWLEMPTKNSN